jgi:hypothetical protein
MKTQTEVLIAKRKLAKALFDKTLTQAQRLVLQGAANALLWVYGDGGHALQDTLDTGKTEVAKYLGGKP